MTALLAKATALALVKHPVVNSSCRDDQSFTYNSSINIAVSIAIDGGLVTPVLKDADKVDIYSLSRKWKELVDKAGAKQLQPHEYNTGFVSMDGSPVLNSFFVTGDISCRVVCSWCCSGASNTDCRTVGPAAPPDDNVDGMRRICWVIAASD